MGVIFMVLVLFQFTRTGSASDYVDTATGLKFVFVKGGCFRMGRMVEKHDSEVCLPDFLIGKYEVTQGQWKTVMGSNPSYFSACGDACPVEQVSVNDARQFMDQAKSKTGKAYRLPTEAEWEYAARSSGRPEQWAGTNSENDLNDYAWYEPNAGKKTHPVGEKKPNGLGIFDMSGNVWEWVTNQPEGRRAATKAVSRTTMSGGIGTLRGGSWQDAASDLEVSKPGWVEPILKTRMVGFRVVLPADQVLFLEKSSEAVEKD